MKRFLLIAAALLALTSTVHAFGDIVIAPPAKEKPDRGNGADHPFPYDSGRLNESPIRGSGRVSVVHNEPAPGDPAAELTKALWLLKDNNYRCSKR